MKIQRTGHVSAEFAAALKKIAFGEDWPTDEPRPSYEHESVPTQIPNEKDAKKYFASISTPPEDVYSFGRFEKRDPYYAKAIVYHGSEDRPDVSWQEELWDYDLATGEWKKEKDLGWWDKPGMKGYTNL